MPRPETNPPTGDIRSWSRLPPLLYPDAYLWLVLVASLDIMLTWAILERNGTEINPVARFFIDTWGLLGAILFKFSITIFVVIICEIVGRPRPMTGRWLSRVAVAISAMPPVYSFGLLLYHVSTLDSAP